MELYRQPGSLLTTGDHYWHRQSPICGLCRSAAVRDSVRLVPGRSYYTPAQALALYATVWVLILTAARDLVRLCAGGVVAACSGPELL